MTDGILYSSTGSELITVGANLVNQRITNSLTLNNDKNIYFQTVNTSAFVGMRQQNDDNFVFYSTNTAYGQRAVWSIFANSITSAFSLTVTTIFNGNITLGGVAVSANGSTGTAGQVLTTNGTSTYWSSAGGGSGTVTSVATGNGMTGGPVTTTGTVSVLANTGIVANATGVYVNSAYIATIAANSSTYSNSSVTNTFTVGTASYFVANGNLGVGTSSPAYKLQVNGSFAATTKSFIIDHPTKFNMKLRYGSLEGPENGVYVRGKLTNSNVIELPEYWLKLVDPDSITVNLTPIGKRIISLYVESIADNKVVIGGDDVNCFYTVFAERVDVDKLLVEF
jgi:hypothetical protein